MRHFFFIVLLLAATAGSFAEETPLNPADVEKLVEQLRSDDFETREKAQAQLGKAGEPARAALENALKDPHAETDFVLRGKRILDVLDAGNHLLRFERIQRANLKYSGSLREALDRLKADFKTEIVTEGEDEFDKTRVDVNVQNATFFEALEAIRVAAKAGYNQTHHPNCYCLALAPLPAGTPCPTALNGPLMFVVSSLGTEIERSITFDAEKPTVEQRLNLSGVLVGAPGVRVSALGLREVQLVDAAGEVFDARTSISPYTFPDQAGAGIFFRININTQFPKGLKGPLGLKFTLVAMLPARLEERQVQLAEKAETVIQTPTGATLTLKPAEKRERRGWEIPFTADSPSNKLSLLPEKRSRKVKNKVKANDDDNDEVEIDESIVSANDPVCSAGILIIDANGKKQFIQPNASSSTPNSSKGLIQIYTAEPKTIVVRKVEAKEERSLPFEMKGLPVP